MRPISATHCKLWISDIQTHETYLDRCVWLQTRSLSNVCLMLLYVLLVGLVHPHQGLVVERENQGQGRHQGTILTQIINVLLLVTKLIL